MWILTAFKINRWVKKIKSMQQSRVHNQPSEEMIKKEVAAYHKLADIFRALQGKRKYPFAHEMSLECFRAAATLDDTAAQYILAKTLLEEAKFRSELQEKGVFANPRNERQAQQLFDEALAYLLAAEQLHHIEAKRLRGLCYINGWGVEIDAKRGFELVVESIDQENSWDKIPQIFSAMGLNKPEFFSVMMQHRDKKNV
jgi:hypothetical protein